MGDGEVRACQGAAESEGVGDVIAVADVGDPDPFKPSELLADGEEVGEP